MKRIFSLTLLIGFISLTAFSQGLDKNKLDDYFNALESNDKFMGSVALSQNGEIIYMRSVGYSDIEQNIKASENSRYAIGSISKTFTAALILKAVEENVLELNQTIETFFPTVQNANIITIKDLLGHRSGIHNFTNDADYLAWNTQPKTEKEMIEIISQAGSDFEPDTRAFYSNSNYVLLSYILEKAYKTSYSNILKEQITEPIALAHTYFGQPNKRNSDEAKSYMYVNGWNISPETDMSIPLGAGGIISTPADIIKFGEALFSGEIISDENVNLMQTMNDGFGLGLFQFPFYEKWAFGHTGGIDGFSSAWGYFSEDGISFAFVSNGSAMNTNDISLTLLHAAFDMPYEIPTFETYDVSEAALESYAGVYSSTQIPLIITVTKDGGMLIAQATGQPSFPLEAFEKDKFKFDQAGLIMEFEPAEQTMILKQGGGVFTFTKE